MPWLMESSVRLKNTVCAWAESHRATQLSPAVTRLENEQFALPPDITTRTPGHGMAKQCKSTIWLLLTIGIGSWNLAHGQSADDLIKSPVNLNTRVAIEGSVPAFAESSSDEGRLSSNEYIGHIMMVLRRTPSRQRNFDALLNELYTPSSPRYHQWLTPSDIGREYGASDNDISNLINWLEAQHLKVENVSSSRTIVTFSGTGDDIGKAFNTELHRYKNDSREFVGINRSPTIPASFGPLVENILGLYTLPSQPVVQRSAKLLSAAQPLYNLANGTHAIFPADFAAIYDLNLLYESNITGVGQTVAVIGNSRVDNSDIEDFEVLSGLPVKDPVVTIPTLGTDPATTGDQNQLEATLDVVRVFGTAPGANVNLVVSADNTNGNGVAIAAQYAVETNEAQIMTISFGGCEAEAGQSAVTLYNNVFSQAAAQGISVFVSSGDSGAAGCDTAFVTPTLVQKKSTNYICSSTFATCVGGTEFVEGNGTYWGSNGIAYGSALSYIPEGAWNDSSSTIVAGTGGGASQYIAKPSWQTGVSPSDGARDTPDVALSASAAHDPYVICAAFSGSSCATGVFKYVGGTSAAAPGMAGIQALLNQRVGHALGNINPLLYTTAANTSLNAFHDITPATSGITNCVLTSPSLCNNSTSGPPALLTAGVDGYAVATGYDQATGLGSIDGFNWAQAAYGNPTRVTPTLSVAANSTTIQKNVAGVYATTLTASLRNLGSATPFGVVQFLVGYLPGCTGCNPLTSIPLAAPIAISGGEASLNAVLPISGVANITAVYSGDINYKGVTSSPVTVVIENATGLMTSTAITGTTPALVGAGQEFTVNAAVTNKDSSEPNLAPYGNAMLYVDNAPVGAPSSLAAAAPSYCGASVCPVALASFSTTISALGTHQISVVYPGALSGSGGGYFAASTSVPVTITVKPWAATPSFSVAAGTYASMQMVTIEDATAGATIYYTIDGFLPTTSSTVYSGPIFVSSSDTLEAIAVASGYAPSAVATAAYTIPIPGASTLHWTWMSGSSTSAQSGVYGTSGTPTAGNVPGARKGASSWTDNSGNLWLFGGAGYDANGTSGLLNDLWEFNPSTNLWTWIGGSSSTGASNCISGVSPEWAIQKYCGQPGVYGEGLVAGHPDPYHPGGRYGASSWTDSSGNFWLFGGYGFDGNGSLGALNDLWEFNPSKSQWVWTGGSSNLVPVEFTCWHWLNESGNSYGYCGQPGSYGVLATPSDANGPGGRIGASSWTDSRGNLWLFGGYGFDASDGMGELNDVWEFNLSKSQWVWMGGSSSMTDMTASGYLGRGGVADTLGALAAGNIPGGRHDASTWTDSSGNFWLFGGYGFDTGGNLGPSNDVWEFNPSTNQWAWMGGSSAAGSNCTSPGGGSVYCAISAWYGTLGTPAAGNNPGSREGATSWTDHNGHFWLFGGYSPINGLYGESQNLFNDLWEFNSFTNEWAWMGGSGVVPPCAVCGQPGVYGTLGAAAAGNIPGSRSLASSWTDSNGNLWLFGGYGFDVSESLGSLNDLWKHPSLAALSAAASPVFTPGTGTYTNLQSVTITGTTPGATIYYTTDGTTPTTSSTKYTGTISVSSTETIESITIASGYTNSAVASATYTIALPSASPIFTPGAGTYTSLQSVTISDSTSGATIYYTTNGTTPTTSSTKYTDAISVSSTETIEAIAVASGHSNSVVASAAYTINSPTPSGYQFVPVTPCRIADTRNATGPFGGPAILGGTSRSFNIPQSSCGIPSNAAAYSLNATVVPGKILNYLTLWPTGQTQPYVSTLNSPDGRVKANAAIVPAGTNGAVSVFVSDMANVILDIDGYFVPAGSNASALAFYPLTPCRIADTRSASGSLGGPSISGGASRSFPIPSSNCNVPPTAKAYSLNVTAIPHETLNYLTAWPTGENQPYVSTLNSPTGTVAANAAILPAGTSGQVSIFVSDGSDVILDINGYFAPPAPGGLSLHTVTPCRVIDTRPQTFNGVFPVNVEGSTCAPSSTAEAYVLNATAVPPGELTYLTLWPSGKAQPYVSTLNAFDGVITSNMAIVPAMKGSIDAFSSNPTNLILDLSSYFAP
jgi:N-acetylneuraminic acid mutarotase